MFDQTYYIESELKKLFEFREYPKSLCNILSKIIRDEAKDKPLNEVLNFFLELYGPKEKTIWEDFSKFQKIKINKTATKTQGYIYGDNLIHYSYDQKKKEYVVRLYDNKTIKEYLSNKEPHKLLNITKENKYRPIKIMQCDSKTLIPNNEVKEILDFAKIKQKEKHNYILRKVFKKIK